MQMKFAATAALAGMALCTALGASAQVTASAVVIPAKVRGEVVVPDSSQWDLTSKASDAQYRIFIAEPVGPAPKDGYAVLYVLDGNGYFATAAETERIQELGGEIRPALIVGIGYPVCACDPVAGLKTISTRRVRDFTPLVSAEKLAKISAQMSGAPTGGADSFYRFIKEELQPWLATLYPIDPADQALFGHSLGGLFVVNTLFKHPQSFRTFIAASPVISWGDGEVLKGQGHFANDVSAGGATPRILITAGGLEQTVLDIPLPPEISRADYAQSITQMRLVENAKLLQQTLANIHGSSGYAVKLQLFEGQTHTSVVPAAIGTAVGFALRFPGVH